LRLVCLRVCPRLSRLNDHPIKIIIYIINEIMYDINNDLYRVDARMKTIAFFNSKGGAGKSTLAVHLGVAAAYDRATALLDADPQGTLKAWSAVRQHESPVVLAVSAASLAGDLARLASQKVALCVLDCPPYITAESAKLVALCDFIIVPVQPTMPDIAGCNHAVDIIKSTGKPFAFVVNRAPARAPEVAQAIEALSQWGEVCPVIVGDRRSFSRALASGQSVIEFEDGSAAAKEAATACTWILSKI
jgi:chromosome partitioning protein